MIRACVVAVTSFVVVSATAAVRAQTPASALASLPSLTLEQAIQYAADHYPAVTAALERVNASTAVVTAARSAYLPRLDSLWQSNRATTNNVFGQVLSQSVIPALSGPVLSSTSARSVWSSAAGAFLSWEPVDFGLRHATVAGAEASLTRARADATLTRLDVQNAVATAFLGVVAAQQAVTAAEADLDRREVLHRIVQTLVDNQLRPGADLSRADAERAAARIRVILASEALTLAETAIARVLGTAGEGFAIDGTALLARTPAGDIAVGAASTHPLAQVHRAAVDQAHAFEGVLARTDLPRMFVQSSVFARGSGAHPNGDLDGGIDGLGLDRANWAAGIQITFPNLFDFSDLRARKAAAAASTRAEAALYDEAVLTVTSRQQAAAALLQAARAVAANTPVQLEAARQSERQARARYDAGLAGIVEVAEAQSLLAEAEVQNQLARVDIWRALLAGSIAHGSLAGFLDILRQP